MTDQEQEAVAKELAAYLTGPEWQNGKDLLLAEVAIKALDRQREIIYRRTLGIDMNLKYNNATMKFVEVPTGCPPPQSFIKF